MRELVLPFVRAVRDADRRPNEQPPQLRVYGYAADGITMIPVVGSGSARVTEILLSTELIDTTRENVRLLFDDVNDGTSVDPPVDYADPTQLQGWTLRALDEWVDYIVPELANRYEPEATFESIYTDFEARFFTDSYVRMWISPLSNFGVRFDSAMAWALRGHRDAAERHAVWEVGREINRRRNGILHGNKDLIRPLFEDLAKFQELTERAEGYMRQSLQLLLLNNGFRERLDDAALGAEVNFKRLPFTF